MLVLLPHDGETTIFIIIATLVLGFIFLFVLLLHAVSKKSMGTSAVPTNNHKSNHNHGTGGRNIILLLVDNDNRLILFYIIQ